MDFIENRDEYHKIIEPVVIATGFRIVEIVSRNLHDGLHLHIVLYSETGISIDDCGKVHRAVQRRIEALTDSRDAYIEVSSPGISRNLKNATEFIVFKGKYVKILHNDSNEWIRYRIMDADQSGVLLEYAGSNPDGHQPDETIFRMEYSEVRKAKLDN